MNPYLDRSLPKLIRSDFTTRLLATAHFLDEAAFSAKDAGIFAEWLQIRGHLYGSASKFMIAYAMFWVLPP